MPRSRRNQNKSNKNKNNKILKRMMLLSNYYRKKLFRGGDLDEAQVAGRIAEIEQLQRQHGSLSQAEQNELSELINLPKTPQVMQSEQTSVAPAETYVAPTQTYVDPNLTSAQPATEDKSLFASIGDSIGNVVEGAKETLGLGSIQKGGKRRSNKRRNNKRQRQSQRKRR